MANTKKTQTLLFLICSALSAALFLTPTGCQSPSEPGPKVIQESAPADAGAYPAARTKESQAALSPQDALAKLRAGNARFVAGQSRARDLSAQVRATAEGNRPGGRPPGEAPREGVDTIWAGHDRDGPLGKF